MTADDQGLFRRDHDEPMAQSPKLDREGFIFLAIGGGLWLLSYADWLPEGLILFLGGSRPYSLLLAAMGLVLIVLPFISHQGARLLATTSARTASATT